jgi:S1-C subfamily serine protease
MSQRRALASIFASALIAASLTAAITVMAFMFAGNADEADLPPSAGDIHAELFEPFLTPPAPAAPIVEPPSYAELSRQSVDWSAVYARVVPSLVTVVTDTGSGSGFFVLKDGHLVTNLHVVSGAEQIHVYLQDRSRSEASLIAKDVGNDIALLKIDAEGVQVGVPLFGNADDLRVGDPVGALGAPFNLPNSLTVGIVSALDRTRQSGNNTLEPLRAMIQTDAALNPGNSGGMLVDERGRVIGIPTQIESPDRASSGIGFAVGINALLRSLPTLLKGEDVERSYLGVNLSQDGSRLEIVDVVCGSAADEANVRVGDRLSQINGESTTTFDELLNVLSDISPGDEITITVQRGLRRLTLNASATAWPTEAPRLGCG